MEWENWEKELNEADIAAELVHQLKIRNINVRCEVKLPSSIHRSGFMRVDVAVIEDGEITYVIEVKYKQSHRKIPLGKIRETYPELRRQKLAYLELEKNYGITVIWLYGINAIPEVINRICKPPSLGMANDGTPF